MQYREFHRLLDLKLNLQRQLHTVGPGYRGKLSRAVEALDNRLSEDPDHVTHLQEYAKRTVKIG